MKSALALSCLVAMLSEVGLSCVAEGDPCRKNGEACCDAASVDQTTFCVGDVNALIVRNYVCMACDNTDLTPCSDFYTTGEWVLSIFYAAFITMGVTVLAVLSALEVLKFLGIVPLKPSSKETVDQTGGEES